MRDNLQKKHPIYFCSIYQREISKYFVISLCLPTFDFYLYQIFGAISQNTKFGILPYLFLEKYSSISPNLSGKCLLYLVLLNELESYFGQPWLSQKPCQRLLMKKIPLVISKSQFGQVFPKSSSPKKPLFLPKNCCPGPYRQASNYKKVSQNFMVY